MAGSSITRLSCQSRSLRFGIYASNYFPHSLSPFADRSSARSFFLQDRFGVDRDLDHVADDDATSV